MLTKPRDRGAWWAAAYGVAQSRTGLKQLSRSSGRLNCGDHPTIRKGIPLCEGSLYTTLLLQKTYSSTGFV